MSTALSLSGNGRGLFNKTGFLPFVGKALGKNLGQATVDPTVYGRDGKRIVWFNAAEVSDTSAMQAGGCPTIIRDISSRTLRKKSGP